MSKKEEIEKLKEEIELEELRLKRAKQKSDQRTRSILKYSAIFIVVINILGFAYYFFDENGFIVLMVALFVFGLISLFGYSFSKAQKNNSVAKYSILTSIVFIILIALGFNLALLVFGLIILTFILILKMWSKENKDE